jgi:hypothetical protein
MQATWLHSYAEVAAKPAHSNSERIDLKFDAYTSVSAIRGVYKIDL